MPVPRRSYSLQTLLDQIDAKWPNRSKISDGWIGDAAHQARESDHNPDPDGTVDAVDITHDPASGADMNKVADAIVSSRDYRMYYIIFDRKIVSSKVNPWNWRPYTGSNPHTKHLHISILDEFQDDRSPWMIGSMGSGSLFESKAPGIMRSLISFLGIQVEDAAAILGNLGHESDGFRSYQQYGHTGSSGAVGWAQWTGSRRINFEEWAINRGMNPRSDEANLGFLIHELTNTSEKRVISMMKREDNIRDKTVTFCDVFERPGIKAYDSRVLYAQRALTEYNRQVPVGSLPVPVPPQGPADSEIISPDNFLSGVRPDVIVVQDLLTSKIEGFPEGYVVTTYVKKSTKFVPKNQRNKIEDNSTSLTSTIVERITKMDSKLLGQVRHVIGVIGAMLATLGFISSDQVTIIGELADKILGPGMIILSMVWSWLDPSKK